MEFLISQLKTIAPFFLLLGVLVFVHEWGHFIVARLCGVRVETFSIGFGPKLFSFKWGHTTYALSLIPLGGYVKMYGDGLDDSIPEQEHSESFSHQSLMEKVAIVAAGPLINLVFAFFIFVVMGALGTPEAQPILGEIEPSTPAFQSGLRYGDRVLSVNSTPVSSYESFKKELNKFSAHPHVRLTKQNTQGEKQELLVPIVTKNNDNPIETSPHTVEIEGLSLLRKSSLFGVRFDSILRQHGLSEQMIKLTHINGQETKDFFQVKQALAKAQGELILKTKKKEVTIPPFQKDWSLKRLGLVSPELLVSQIQKRSPSDKAGLKKEDHILQINGINVDKWEQVVEAIKSTKKDQASEILIGRADKTFLLSIVPKMTELITATGQVEYRPTIGIMPALEYLPPVSVIRRSFNPLKLFKQGLQKTYKWTAVTVMGFKKLLTGEVSHKTLSGVVAIGKVAKDSLQIGWIYFLQMMAILSINLFLLNLLPVPVLDGGHLLFYGLEALKGSPVSLRTRLIGQQLGLVVILSLVAYTLFNDFTRIVFSGW